MFTIGVFFLLEPSWATIQQTDEPPANPELIPMVVIFTIIIATAFLTRFLVRQKVKRMMMASSDEQRTDSLPEKEADQVLAEHPPAFIELNASSEIADAVQLRESLIDRAQSLFGRAFRYDLAAVAGYILIPMIGGGDALEGVMIALPLLFVSTLRFIAFRDQFRAHQPGLFGCLRPFYTAWFEIAKPQWRTYIAAIAIAAALNNAYDYFGYPWWIEGLRWVMAAAFHMMLIFWLMVSAQNTSNLKLLILRVFNMNETAEFTFEGLLKYWKYFGSFFTVVDPSFLKSQTRQRNRLIPLLMVTFFGIIFLIYGVEETFGLNPELFIYYVILPVVLLLAFTYVVLNIRLIDRNFVRSQADLEGRLLRLERWPRKWDLTFKSLPTMCYDNTWKVAVSEFIKTSEVILMDLRGYSDERKGCEYEVGLLLDTVPLQRIAFLVDAPGLPLVRKLILKRWERLLTTSPNLNQVPTQALIYVSSKQNKKDIQGIMDILMEAAIRSGAESVR